MTGLLGTKPAATQPVVAAGLQIQTSTYGIAVPVVYGQTRIGGNLGWYDNFKAVKANNGGSKGGKGGDSGQYNYSASLLFLLCEGPVSGVPGCWVNQSQFAIGDISGASVFTGTYPQTSWSYLTTNFANAAVPYGGIVYVGLPNYSLSTSATLPNLNWEVQGRLVGTAANHIDADPAQVVTDILTNPNYGIGFPANRVGALLQSVDTHIVGSGPFTATVTNAAFFSYNCDVEDASGNALTCVAGSPGPGQYSFTAGGVYTFNAAQAGASVTITYAALFPLQSDPSGSSYVNFTEASGLWISPAYTTQTQCSAVLDDIVQNTYSEFVWSSGVLTVVPRGYSNVTGNGFNYVAPSSILFSLTDDDLMPNQGGSSTDDPILLTRTRKSDQINVVSLEYLNRGNYLLVHSYPPAVVEVSDQGLIDAYGRRAATSQQAHLFCDAGAANVSAQLLLQKQYILNNYTVTLDQRYCLLDPMDLVNLTDPYLFPDLAGNQQVARVTEITENDDGTLTVILEEYPVGLGTAAPYSLNQGGGYIPNYNVAPGNVNAPIFFEPNASFLSANSLTGPVVIIAASGSNPAWGGCDVWVSLDNVTYEFLGHISHKANQGYTTASFASGSDPDTANTLSVNLTESAGSLAAVSQPLADNFITLCYVADDTIGTNVELIAFEQATLISANNYDLGKHGLTAGYLRRGVYGTTIRSHAVNSAFTLIDGNLLSYDLPVAPVSYVGKTLYFKFLSANIYGGAQQQLTDVSPYIFVPTGVGIGVKPPGTLGLTSAIVTNTDGTIAASIQASGGATAEANYTNYEIQWRAHGSGPWTAGSVLGPAVLTDLIAPVTPGAAFDVQVAVLRVTAQGGFQSSWVGATITAATQATAPATPTGVTATANAAALPQVALAWTANAEKDVNSYDVLFNTSNTTSGATLFAHVPATTSPACTVTGLQSGINYFFFVRAENTSDLVSAYTSGVSAAPLGVVAPGSVSLSAGFNQQADGTIQPYLEIAWTATTDALFDQYEVQWQAHGAGTWGNDTIVPGGALGFQVVPIVAGQAYDARVRTVRHTTQGVFTSAWVTQTNQTVPTKSTGPIAPASPTVTGIFRGATLNWLPNTTDSDFDHFQVFASGTNSTSGLPGPQIVADQLKSTFWTHTDLPINPTAVALYYWVKAVNTSGIASGFSGGTGATGIVGTATTLNNEDALPGTWTAVGTKVMAAFTPPGGGGAHDFGSVTTAATNAGSVTVIVSGSFQMSGTGAGLEWDFAIYQDGGGTPVLSIGGLNDGSLQAPFSFTTTINTATTHSFDFQWFGSASSVKFLGGTATVLVPQR